MDNWGFDFRWNAYAYLHNAFEGDPVCYPNGPQTWSGPKSDCDPSPPSTFHSCCLWNEWNRLQAISVKMLASYWPPARKLHAKRSVSCMSKSAKVISRGKRCSELGSIHDLRYNDRLSTHRQNHMLCFYQLHPHHQWIILLRITMRGTLLPRPNKPHYRRDYVSGPLFSEFSQSLETFL
jgi:hypothetical protein